MYDLNQLFCWFLVLNRDFFLFYRKKKSNFIPTYLLTGSKKDAEDKADLNQWYEFVEELMQDGDTEIL